MTGAVTDKSIEWAVEIAKAGMSIGPGSMLNAPDAIAKFIETVARKIESLRTGVSQP